MTAEGLQAVQTKTLPRWEQNLRWKQESVLILLRKVYLMDNYFSFLFNYENTFWRHLPIRCSKLCSAEALSDHLTGDEPWSREKLFLSPQSSFLPLLHSDRPYNISMKSITKSTETISLNNFPARTHDFNLPKVLLVVNHLFSFWAVWKLVDKIRMPVLQRSYCFLQRWDLNSDWSLCFWHSA